MPIRVRIVLATAVLIATSLLILGGGIYVMMSRHLHSSLDSRLQNVFRNYQSNYQEKPDAWFVPGTGVLVIPPNLNPNPFASSGLYIQILDQNGIVQRRSDNLGTDVIQISNEAFAQSAQGDTVFYTTTVANGPVRVLSGPLYSPQRAETWFIQIAEPLTPVQRTLSALKQTLLIGSTMATILLAAGAWVISEGALSPLARMSHTARSIGSTRDLSQRIDLPRTHDELQDLAETFNDMLARLEETFNAQRRFVADASHELRTPLTALRANSEIMLRQVDSGIVDSADLREGLTDVRDEVDRMTRLVQNLLTLARADVGWRPEMESVDLVEIVRDAGRFATPLAHGRPFSISLPAPDVDGAAPQIIVEGNADQLRQLILILLDNAFTYASHEGDVTLTLDRDGQDAIIAVADSGPGIRPEHLRRVFERFYRADDARSRAHGGAGLGLSIARWIAAIHRGEIDVDSELGDGTTFRVRVPITAKRIETAMATGKIPASI
ncbi:MAG: ATP-binding protein [Thermomicrobiales bacterium]